VSPFLTALLAALDESGISKTELARRIGRSQPQVTRICNGQTASPPKDTVDAIEGALGVSPGRLWDLLHGRADVGPNRPARWVLPLYGTVPAGNPVEADAAPPEMVDLLDKLGDDVFLLKLRGVSMEGDAMLEGDFVAVRRTRQPNHGDIVVANVDGEDTVKRLFHRRGGWELVGSHPDFPPRRISNAERLGIVGVVVGLVRLY
jgi:DNA polymerase V